jgi:hypothetical protein
MWLAFGVPRFCSDHSRRVGSLVTTAVANPPATATKGGKFTISDTVSNQGTIPSIATYTRYYPSVDGVRGDRKTVAQLSAHCGAGSYHEIHLSHPDAVIAATLSVVGAIPRAPATLLTGSPFPVLDVWVGDNSSTMPLGCGRRSRWFLPEEFGADSGQERTLAH